MRNIQELMEIQKIDYTKLISNKIRDKKNSLQFLPTDLYHLRDVKVISYKNTNLKSAYIIDIVHNLILKYFFKKDNSFVLNSIILKKKYGHLYNIYISYLIDNNFIKMDRNYKAGVTSRTYSLNPRIFKSKIHRYSNQDKVLIKKYKSKIIELIDYNSNQLSPIDVDVRQKLVSDLFQVTIDKNRSMAFLNGLKRKDIDIFCTINKMLKFIYERYLDNQKHDEKQHFVNLYKSSNFFGNLIGYNEVINNDFEYFFL
jgi:hypothetical protein